MCFTFNCYNIYYQFYIVLLNKVNNPKGMQFMTNSMQILKISKIKLNPQSTKIEIIGKPNNEPLLD